MTDLLRNVKCNTISFKSRSIFLRNMKVVTKLLRCADSLELLQVKYVSFARTV